MNLYEKLAEDIETSIRQGVYRHGERLPSVRQISQQHRISVTTAIRAYLLLESRGLVTSRPQSGYFVNRRDESERKALELRPSKPIPISSPVDVSRLVLSTLRSIGVDDAVPLGSPYPDPSLFPFERINRYAYDAGRGKAQWGVTDALPPGNAKLVRQIARRYLENGMAVDPNEIIITVGATEAINLCLQAVAKPGDVIAVESPTFYAMLHAIERMGMKAIEVSTHPEHGIDIEALAAIVESQPIAACMVMPNFQNPLGFLMPDERKRELVELLTKRNIPVIENGVYNELHFDSPHPSTLKSFDTKGLVLHCSSFSKSLTSAYRIGWALPGRYRDQVEKLKFLNTLTSPSIPQLAIAEFLERDGFEHHLRKVRKAYAQQANLMKAIVSRFFPEGTRMSNPAGGYVLWVELPPRVDSMRLYKLALDQGITIGPGYMFSVSETTYRNFIRLNYSSPWSGEIEQAVITVGKLVSMCAS
ncbi:aminotransferase class I and II family protein [Paraburkholderia xenovorans LB400]|uniref:Transcriptional regulator, GntR family n=1 Tax=Paraburkholderia xenovorans (strain LB400) TaxID=266265 RepID=Q144S7_PARXL|nr:PLP-dependent aminotransferase family protein [Paraburkholderia xenovorans]ABE29162.1 transcriptional regulator, GntR family [Paraburkholderia xenovorans LB400]AIP31297.1 aminotransferase class I and II family protein [Paraburkholderia xenovorans LB400]NPT35398.1 aminotransferase class I/II-fold pyridoxal phosphate-dependent enzyme [Paraburkholderia xenovorans]